ncbi:MAG: ABC transporter permease [Lachnospiraceae bacterium]|nr:ABC transporter permease [Lachnospiraceae bacterium]
MKISTLRYSIKQSFISIRRNLLFSLASIGTIVACLFLFGVFYAIILNMANEVKSIQSTLTVSVFFDEGTDENRIMEIGKELQSISNVDTINYVSAEKAWAGYIDDVYGGDTDYVHAVFGDDNPLENASSYEITLKNINKQDETVEIIKKIPDVRKVNSSDVTAQSLNSVSRLVGYASVGIIVILFLVSLFLISNTITIGISVRKEEIAIMKLIGAKDSFVRTPFVIEGIIIGLVGSFIPLVMLYFMYNAMSQYLSEHFKLIANMFKMVPAMEVFKGMAPISLAMGVGMGFFGSLLTTRKHLRV